MVDTMFKKSVSIIISKTDRVNIKRRVNIINLKYIIYIINEHSLIE